MEPTMRPINERDQKEEIIDFAIVTMGFCKAHIIQGNTICKPYVIKPTYQELSMCVN